MPTTCRSLEGPGPAVYAASRPRLSNNVSQQRLDPLCYTAHTAHYPPICRRPWWWWWWQRPWISLVLVAASVTLSVVLVVALMALVVALSVVVALTVTTRALDIMLYQPSVAVILVAVLCTIITTWIKDNHNGPPVTPFSGVVSSPQSSPFFIFHKRKQWQQDRVAYTVVSSPTSL